MASSAEQRPQCDAIDSLLEPEVKVIPLTGRQKFVKFINDNFFMVSTITGVIIGFILGIIIRSGTDGQMSDQLSLWLNMPGEIFIRLLKLTILPLIAANVVVVSASLDPKVNGKISLVAFAYIIVANVSSALIGSMTAILIRPGISRAHGNATSSGLAEVQIAKLKSSDVFADLLLNLFPDNIVGVSLFKSQTRYVQPLPAQLRQLGLMPASAAAAGDAEQVADVRTVENAYSVNMIGVIFCAAVFGMAARTLGEDGKPFIVFFQSLASVVIKVMRWFLWLTPSGVCFMIAASIAGVADASQTMMKLGLFIVCVTVGLAIHFVLLQLVFLAVSRRNPLLFLPHTIRSWFISFATTAPVVAIPEIMEGCNNYGLSPSVTSFVVPFAAAIKGDGSACFIAAATVFVAQMTGFPVGVGTIVVIVLLVSSAMLALPNIPSASLVILVTILSSVGISEKEVALLYAVDWLLDRMRSGSIGLSHSYCAAFTHFVCSADLKEQTAKSPTNGTASDTSKTLSQHQAVPLEEMR